MADLPSIAQRINDVEVAANAPVTETLMRRKGSDINFLLDFLGVSDGSTSTSGILSDFLLALTTVSSHTIALQANINGSTGTQLVGTYSPIRFVDRVFWKRKNNLSGNIVDGDPIDPIFLMKSIDSGPVVTFSASRVTPSNASVSSGFNPANYGTRGVLDEGTLNSIGEFHKDLNTSGGLGSVTPSSPRGRLFDGGLGVIGYESPMRANEWTRLGVLDYHEFATQAQVFSNPRSNGSGQVTQIYMSYELNFMSAPIYD